MHRSSYSGNGYIHYITYKHLRKSSIFKTGFLSLTNPLETGRISLAKTRCSSLCGSAKISHISYNSAEMASHGATARVLVDNSSSFDLVDKLSPLDNYVGGTDLTGASTDSRVPDPINWFCGVLVPPQLRQAQVSFRRSLRLVAELATRRTALLRSAKQLSDLIEARDRSDNESLVPPDSKPTQPSQITH